MTVLIAMRGFTTQNCRVAYRNEREKMRKQEVQEPSSHTSTTMECPLGQLSKATQSSLNNESDLLIDGILGSKLQSIAAIKLGKKVPWMGGRVIQLS